MLHKHVWRVLFLTLLATFSLATPSLTSPALSLRDTGTRNRTHHPAPPKDAASGEALAPVGGDITYEELTCLGFSPVKKRLSATFEVKLPYGFSGDFCTAGSWEYVRFYASDHDGSEWEDLGVASVNTHDIIDKEDCEGKPTKPLLYTVSIRYDPKHKSCKKPVLPRVRAILSWEEVPPSDTPDFVPVWGNILDEHVQPLPKEFNKRDSDDNHDDEHHDEHKDGHDDKHNDGHHDKHAKRRQAHHANDANNHGAFNTFYEELTCLGLDSNRSSLVATVHVKQDHGYFATPCDCDSFEYVSFWADWENCCSWTFLGTRKFNVHDFKPLPDGGLMYTALMPVELCSVDCKEPKAARVRAALGWQQVPPTPPSVATWGNFIETHVQLPRK